MNTQDSPDNVLIALVRIEVGQIPNFTPLPAADVTASLIISGSGDPFLSYELNIENTTDESLSGYAFALIDIDPVTGGLPIDTSLQIDWKDPGGKAPPLNGLVSHKTFLEVEGTNRHTTKLNDVTLSQQIIGPTKMTLTAGPIRLPEPMPHQGSDFDRLVVQLNFANVLPGDSTFFKGTSTIAVAIKGDVNSDGIVDFLDIMPFINAQPAEGDEDTFLLLTPGGCFLCADIDMDGAVDFLDITPFVNLLDEVAAAVPEPASGMLLLLGLVSMRRIRGN